jgi:hypothetical protein
LDQTPSVKWALYFYIWGVYFIKHLESFVIRWKKISYSQYTLNPYLVYYPLTSSSNVVVQPLRKKRVELFKASRK